MKFKSISVSTFGINTARWVITLYLKMDMPILTCIYFTLNWLTLISEMHFVKFHPEVASCLLSRGKRKYAPLGMRLLWKYIRNYFLVYQLTSHFLLYLQNYKEFEAKILDMQSEKYGLSFDIKKYTSSSWALGDENVIGIRAFKGVMHDSSRNWKWPLFHRDSWTFLSNFTPCFMGNQGKFASKIPFPYFLWFQGHVFISPLHHGESQKFSPKKYQKFFPIQGHFWILSPISRGNEDILHVSINSN